MWRETALDSGLRLSRVRPASGRRCANQATDRHLRRRGFSMKAGDPLLDELVLQLTGGLTHASVSCRRRAVTPTTTSSASIALFGGTLPAIASIAVPRLRSPCEPRRHLLDQDLIYVGGGRSEPDRRLASARHRPHPPRGLESRRGAVRPLRRIALLVRRRREHVSGPPERVEGLGSLPWSNAVHYSSEHDRREAYHRWLRDGMRTGYAADDGAALHFIGDELAQVVAREATLAAIASSAAPDASSPPAGDSLPGQRQGDPAGGVGCGPRCSSLAPDADPCTWRP